MVNLKNNGHNQVIYKIDQQIALRAVHPLSEPFGGQLLALCYSSTAGHTDGIHLVIPAGKDQHVKK